MPPTYSPFWKPFETLGRLGLMRRNLDLGDLKLTVSPGTDFTDVKRGEDWRRFVEPATLYDLWGPPHASPWSGYHKPTLFAALDSVRPPRIAPIPSPGLHPRGDLPRVPWLDGHTAVVLDLPGPASVAYGALLCRGEGMAPVATFNNWPHARGVVDAGRVLAALLYYAPWVEEGWNAVLRPEEAPPVIMADAARMGTPVVKPLDFDNRYFLLDTDLPSAATLAARGVERVVYVRPEGTPAEGAHRDLSDVNPWLHQTTRRLPVLYARASLTEWALGAPEPFDVKVRKTQFTTTRDPAFKGFRRNAAGGFGVLVPEPGSGGG